MVTSKRNLRTIIYILMLGRHHSDIYKKKFSCSIFHVRNIKQWLKMYQKAAKNMQCECTTTLIFTFLQNLRISNKQKRSYQWLMRSFKFQSFFFPLIFSTLSAASRGYFLHRHLSNQSIMFFYSVPNLPGWVLGVIVEPSSDLFWELSCHFSRSTFLSFAPFEYIEPAFRVDIKILPLEIVNNIPDSPPYLQFFVPVSPIRTSSALVLSVSYIEVFLGICEYRSFAETDTRCYCSNTQSRVYAVSRVDK